MKGALPGTGALLLLLLGGCNSRASSAALPAAVLQRVRDVPLAGPAARFDYQDVDADARRLYVAHLGANQVDVVNLDTLEPVASVPGVAQVHGVRLALDVHTLFATATGADEVVAIDTATSRITGRAPTGRFPDGVAYDPVNHLVAVSNKDDGSETVLDALAVRAVRTVPLGREVGNVTYDPVRKLMTAAVGPPEELAAFDAATGEVTARIRLSGCGGAHGVYVDPEDWSSHRTRYLAPISAGGSVTLAWKMQAVNSGSFGVYVAAPTRRAFVACEDNARLAVVDLDHDRQTGIESVGGDPDVLAFDPGISRLYVAAETGVVSVFDVAGGAVHKLGEGRLAARAHTVAVDPRTHRVFFPLENLGGRAVLRVMQP